MPEFHNAYVVAQLIGALGTIAVVVGMQQKKYNRIVFCKIFNEFIATIHYFLIGGYTGMVINLASCLTNGVYWYRITKGKSTLIFQILFGALFLIKLMELPIIQLHVEKIIQVKIVLVVVDFLFPMD